MDQSVPGRGASPQHGPSNLAWLKAREDNTSGAILPHWGWTRRDPLLVSRFRGSCAPKIPCNSRAGQSSGHSRSFGARACWDLTLALSRPPAASGKLLCLSVPVCVPGKMGVICAAALPRDWTESASQSATPKSFQAEQGRVVNPCYSWEAELLREKETHPRSHRESVAQLGIGSGSPSYALTTRLACLSAEALI